jgi:hypothetical protein
LIHENTKFAKKVSLFEVDFSRVSKFASVVVGGHCKIHRSGESELAVASDRLGNERHIDPRPTPTLRRVAAVFGKMAGCCTPL